MTVAAIGFTDPVLDGPLLALHRPGGTGEIRGPTGAPVPGTHPAVGGGRRAWIDPTAITVEAVATIPAPGADSVAVSASFVAWRAGTAINVATLDPARFAQRTVITGQVGRPGAERQPARVRHRGPDRVDRPRHRTSARCCAAKPAPSSAARRSSAPTSPTCAPPTSASRSGSAPLKPQRAVHRHARLRHHARPPAATPATSRTASPPRATSTSRSGQRPPDGRRRHAHDHRDRARRRLRHAAEKAPRAADHGP